VPVIMFSINQFNFDVLLAGISRWMERERGAEDERKMDNITTERIRKAACTIQSKLRQVETYSRTQHLKELNKPPPPAPVKEEIEDESIPNIVPIENDPNTIMRRAVEQQKSRISVLQPALGVWTRELRFKSVEQRSLLSAYLTPLPSPLFFSPTVFQKKKQPFWLV
jgi:hypothetical protein